MAPPFFRPVVLVLSLLVARDVAAREQNVILLTLDGVRWQEVFQGPDPTMAPDDVAPVLPSLREGGAVLLGEPGSGIDVFAAGDTCLSLPGYQALLSGAETTCRDNGCGRVGVPTLLERLRADLRIARRRVATIGSWGPIAHAAEHELGATEVNTAFDLLRDGRADALRRRLNQAQRRDRPPWGNARWDRYTMAHAIRYLKVHRPRFLFVALDDADEWGHLGDYPQYLASLRRYDAWIRQLSRVLKSMGDYGRRTSIIVTTDHGRGTGEAWRHHGRIPEARRIWISVRGPLARSMQVRAPATLTHLDVRPTLERFFGLPTCPSCGPGIAMD